MPTPPKGPRSPALRPPKTKAAALAGEPVVGYRLNGMPSKPSGRPPNAVAVACRLAFEQRVPLLERIADGRIARVHEVATASGKVVTVRVAPTITERLKAMEVLARAGRVMSDEPLGIDHPVAARLDLSKYTSAELTQLEILLAKGLRVSEAGEGSSLPPSATNDPEGR